MGHYTFFLSSCVQLSSCIKLNDDEIPEGMTPEQFIVDQLLHHRKELGATIYDDYTEENLLKDLVQSNVAIEGMRHDDCDKNMFNF